MTAAIAALRDDPDLVARMRTADGVRWWDVQRKLKAALPPVMPDQERHQLSFDITPRALNEILGEGAWESYHPTLPDGSRDKAWVRARGGAQ